MIEHVSKVFELNPDFVNNPWLVVGKGPSFNAAKAFHFLDIGSKNGVRLATINQTPNHLFALKADLAFYHDIEPFLDTKPDRMYACCLPWMPHFRARPDIRTIKDWHSHTVNLRGPLCYSYDLSTTKERNFPDHPLIESVCFTYETVLQILGYAGVKEIVTLGIDGGSARHPSFSETHQEERPESYDYQFEAEKKWKAKFNLKIVRM